MKLRAIVCVTALLAVSWVLASVAEGNAHADATTGNSFEGTCQLTGDITLDGPLSPELRPTTFPGTGTGTCTGSLNGGPSEDHATVNQISGLGTLNRAGGHTPTGDLLVFEFYA